TADVCAGRDCRRVPESRAAAHDFRSRASRIHSGLRKCGGGGASLMQADALATRIDTRASVFEGVTPYQWLVVIIASCGWLFDCMDQRIFILARTSALQDLLHGDATALKSIEIYKGYATTSMILGWATGGIIFGV